jgi:anti-sigma B factor antagonist
MTMDDDQILEIAVTHERGATVLAVAGELDAASAPALRGPIDRAVSNGGALVLDLIDCDFVDSTGLHAIIDARAALEASGGRFAVVCAPSGPVARVIEVAVPGMLPVHGSRADALADVSG